MSEQQKCSSNVTIDQMIEHMTADLHGSDGQYIQLGFTPPQTPNDQAHLGWNSPPNGSNIYSNQYAMNRNRMTYPNSPLEHTTPTYQRQPPGFNNFIPNIIQPDRPDLIPMIPDLRNSGYILYNHQNQSYIPNQQDHSMYMPPYQDTRDFGMFIPPQESPNFIENNYQPKPPITTPVRTPLIENLVGNWAPNTSGTYSPFGNGDHISEDSTPLRNRVKKPRMVAEVKPMRPSYSDVLAKSVPSSKPTKNEVKATKTQVSKKTPSKVAPKVQVPARQAPTEDGDKNVSPRKGVNMWTTIGTEDSSINSDNDGEKDVKVKKQPDKKSEKKLDSEKVTSHTKMYNFEWDEDTSEDSNVTNTEKVFTKSVKKSKDSKPVGGNKLNERNSSYGVVDKPSSAGRRGHRFRRRENTNSTFHAIYRSFKQYVTRWSTFALCFIVWLLHLISDVCTLSVHLTKDLCSTSWTTIKSQTQTISKTTVAIFSKIQIFAKIIRYVDENWGHKWWAFWNRGNKETKKESWNNTSGLETNIPMPGTGEEAMKRLLACKGKDPYSILGVTPDCTDDDIKKYYKRQAFLVHPDKNPQPGAEEAFKILVHAFDIIGEPERRVSYDRKVAESHQVEQAWSELNDLLSQLHQKMEYAANTIRCTNCTKRHRRIHVDRPCYAARMCAQCKIHHSAKEGDIWAESQCFGFLWYYYACMDGAVYDITEWASCQHKNLKHLRPNTHQVQYRIVLGKQQNNSQNTGQNANPRHRGNKVERETDFEEFLNSLNLYQKTSGGAGTPTSPAAETTANRTDSMKNRKKHKRKK